MNVSRVVCLVSLMVFSFVVNAETMVCNYTVPGVGNGQDQDVIQHINKNDPAVGDSFQLVGGIGKITAIKGGKATMELSHRNGTTIHVKCEVSAINPGVQGHGGAARQVERIMQGQGK